MSAPLIEQKKNLAKRTNRAHWRSGSSAPSPFSPLARLAPPLAAALPRLA